jgi:hypothetical protein
MHQYGITEALTTDHQFTQAGRVRLTDQQPKMRPTTLKNTARHPEIAALGATACLRQPILTLLCSVACPGDVILQAYELAA